MSTDPFITTPKVKLQALLENLLETNESKIKSFQNSTFSTSNIKKNQHSLLLTSLSISKINSQRMQNNIRLTHHQVSNHYNQSQRVSNIEIAGDQSLQDENISLLTDLQDRPKFVQICKDCIKKQNLIYQLQQQILWMKEEKPFFVKKRTPSEIFDPTEKLKESIKILKIQMELKTKKYYSDLHELKERQSQELQNLQEQLGKINQKNGKLQQELEKYNKMESQLADQQNTIKALEEQVKSSQNRFQSQCSEIEVLLNLEFSTAQKLKNLFTLLTDFFETAKIIFRIAKGENPIGEVINVLKRKPIKKSTQDLLIKHTDINGLISALSLRLEKTVEVQVKLAEMDKQFSDLLMEFNHKYLQSLIY